MTQVHLALVEIQGSNNKTPVAVSFPNYKERSASSPAFIGNKMRLFAADSATLETLNISRWLNRLEDYVHIKAVTKVPDNIESYESFNRVTKAGNADKHIRRRMKRHNETEEQASLFYLNYKMDEDVKALPFIRLKSLGGGDEFNMSIKRKCTTVEGAEYCFSTYGFNPRGALPKFNQ